MKKQLAIFVSLIAFLSGVPAFLWAQVSQERFAENLGRSYNHFGFKLFHKLLPGDLNKNIFMSPTSVAIALTMTYQGAAGDTRQAMARTLEIQGVDLEEVNRASAGLKKMLSNPDPQLQLSIANSLWSRQGITFKADFLERNQKFFGASLRELNFADPKTPAMINAWVNQETNGKIKEIIKKIDPSEILLLINAIYFKGKWTKPFDPGKTKEGPFTLLDGREKKHPIMSQSGKYQYFRGKKFQAVSLPYGTNEKISLDLFLPNRDSGLKEFYQELTAANWQHWLGTFRMTSGTIGIPRLKLEYGTVSLKASLAAMGMAVAFDREKADFTNLCQNPAFKVYLGDVLHKTALEVNEEGTEAAAATAVKVVMTAAPQKEQPFEMIVDRPFFLAIRDQQTGVVLFMGSIVQPE
jgi:serine protease inhibitor